MTTRDLYLRRLERLCRVRLAYVDDLNDIGLQLLDRCIKATLGDCQDYGAGDEAREIVGSMTDALRAQGRAL